MEHETVRADVVMAEMRAGFAGLSRRIDDLVTAQRETNGKAAKALSLISGHDSDIRSLTNEIVRQRDTTHEHANAIHTLAAREQARESIYAHSRPTESVSHVGVSIENVPATFGSIKWIVGLMGASAAAMYGILRFLGWHE
jgi:hypothetical protein